MAKDKDVLKEENEIVTPEVVADNVEVSTKKQIEKLKAELAEKDSQIELLGSGSQKPTRAKKKETLPGGNKKAGYITIYEMR